MNCAACGIAVAPMHVRGRGVEVCGCTPIGGFKICLVRSADGLILCDRHFTVWFQAAREHQRWALRLWKEKKGGIILSTFAFGATAKMFGVKPRALKRAMTRNRMYELARKRAERDRHDWATRVAIKKLAQEEWDRMDPWKRALLSTIGVGALLGAGMFSFFRRRAAA